VYSNVYNFLWWFGLLKVSGTDIFDEKQVQNQHHYYFDFVDLAFTISTIINPQCSWVRKHFIFCTRKRLDRSFCAIIKYNESMKMKYV
jgi:hypothetical protein